MQAAERSPNVRKTKDERCLSGATLISVMETADFWDRDDLSARERMDYPVIGRVLLESKMRSSPMVVTDVGCESFAQVCFVDYDHMIQTFASNGSDQAFDIGTLPRTHRTGDNFLDRHAGQSAPECLAVNPVAISQ